MASVSKLAITEDQAREALEMSAFLLANALGLDKPVFELHKRHDAEYRRIHELRLISEFMSLVSNLVIVNEARREESPDSQTLEKISALIKGNWTKQEMESLILGGDNANPN